ncbi:MAG: CoA-binding protein [Peptococcaceae bacterium]|nr:CoA-binding protein [Peptococcaceae bacterium]
MNSKKQKVYEITGALDTSMSYAVLANADRLKKHRHAWKVWHTLKDFGCKVFMVAPELSRFEGSKIYPDLASLEGKIDVVIPCLGTEYLQELVTQTAGSGAKYIWFQETNWTPDLDAQCRENGIEVVRGCVLKHKLYKRPLAYFHPCYWHGWKEKKVPGKYQKI